MRRSHWVGVRWLLALVLALGCCACSAGSAVEPLRVSLAQLAADEANYDGRNVEIQGTVRRFASPGETDYFVLEDTRPNRLALEPASAVEPFTDQAVDVVGTFHFDDRHGRRVSVARVGRLGAAASD